MPWICRAVPRAGEMSSEGGQQTHSQVAGTQTHTQVHRHTCTHASRQKDTPAMTHTSGKIGFELLLYNL
jgi:hypothetical protein